MSVNENIPQAENIYWNYGGFHEQVRNGRPWDYKQQGQIFEPFDNFNFGATGVAVGFPSQIVLRGAGWAQSQAGTRDSANRNCWGFAPYGDDPNDQFWIKQGIRYYENECFK